MFSRISSQQSYHHKPSFYKQICLRCVSITMNNMKLLYSSILVVLTHEEVLFFCKFYWPQINNTLANCYINSLNFIAMFCKSKNQRVAEYKWMILLHPNYPHFIRPQDHEHLKANQMLWKDQPVFGLVGSRGCESICLPLFNPLKV